jgi:hypothetical protein
MSEESATWDFVDMHPLLYALRDNLSDQFDRSTIVICLCHFLRSIVMLAYLLDV